MRNKKKKEDHGNGAPTPRIFKGPEPYGPAGLAGNKFWVRLPDTWNLGMIDDFLQGQIQVPDNWTARFPGGEEREAKRMTFFFYDDRRPDEDGSKWLADYMSEVERDGDRASFNFKRIVRLDEERVYVGP